MCVSGEWWVVGGGEQGYGGKGKACSEVEDISGYTGEGGVTACKYRMTGGATE